MSKMNNNSRKNVKNSKNVSKKAVRSRKSSKKNFKIETLEPRLMMDASAGFDVDKIEEYASQFESIASTVADNVYTTVGSVAEFDVSNLGVLDNIESPIALFSESGDLFKTTIANKVADVLKGAIQNASDASENISLSEFVSTYVDGFLNDPANGSYEGISFGVDGDKLVITLDLSNEKTINNMGFDLKYLGEIKIDGQPTLTSSAEIKVTIDLNKNENEYYLDDDTDFSVETPVIAKLEATIQNLGLKAKYMDLTLVEQNLQDETSPDLKLSYNDSEPTKIDLEFILEDSKGLPFTVTEGEYFKITNDNQNIDAKIPEFKIKNQFLMKNVLKGLSNTNLPVFESLKIPVGAGEYTIPEIASEMDVLWKYIPGAILSNVNESKLNLSGFKSLIDSAIAKEYTGLNNVFEGIGVEGNASEFDLVEGENNLALKINLKSGTLNTIDLDLFDLNDVEMKTSFVINVVLNVSSGKISFENASLKNFDVDVPSKSVAAVQIGGLGAALQDGNFSLNVSVENVNNQLKIRKCVAALGYSKIELKSGTTIVAQDENGKFEYSYSNNKWLISEKIEPVLTISSNETFSVSESIRKAGDVPYIANKKINFVKESLSISDIASKIDSLRKNLSLAINDNIPVEADETYNIEINDLKSSFIAYAGETVKELFSCIEVELVDVTGSAFNILDADSGKDKIYSVNKGRNNFSVSFKMKQGSLDGVDVYGYTLSSVTVDTEVCLSFCINVDDSGKASFGEFSLNSFDNTVKPKNSVEGLPFEIDASGFVISYASNEWQEDGFEFKTKGPVFDKAVSALANVPALKNSATKLGENIKDVSKVWDEVYKSLTTSVTVNGVGDAASYTLDTRLLKSTFEKFVVDKKGDVNGLFSNVKVVQGDADLVNGVFKGVDIWGGASSNVYSRMTGNVYTFIFTHQTSKVDELQIHSQSIKNLDAETLIAVKVTISNSTASVVDYDVALDSVAFDIDLDKSVPQGLPFSFSEKNVKEVWNGSAWNNNISDIEISLSDSASIESDLSSFKKAKVSEIGELKFKIGGNDYSLNLIADEVENCWNCVVEALYSVVANNSSVSNLQQQVEAAYKKALNENNITPKIFGDSLAVTVSGNVYSLALSLKNSSIDDLKIDGVDLGQVDVLTGSLKVSIEKVVEGNVVFLKNAKFGGLELNVVKNYTDDKSIKVVDGLYTATLKNSKLDMTLSIISNESQNIKCDLSYDSLDVLNENNIVVHSLASGKFEFANGKWVEPVELKNVASSVGLDAFSLSEKFHIDEKFDIPYVGKLKLGSTNYSAYDILKIVDEIRTNVMLALQGKVSLNGTVLQLNIEEVNKKLETLNSSLNSLEKAAVSSFLSSLNIKIGQKSYDLMKKWDDLKADTNDLSVVDLGGDSFEIEFCLKKATQDVEFESLSFKDTAINTIVSVNVKTDNNGDFIDTSFKSFVFELPEITAAATAEDATGAEDLAVRVEDGCLKISITESGVDVNVKLDEFIDYAFLPFVYDVNLFEDIEIPYIEDLNFSFGGIGNIGINDVFEILDGYSRAAQNYFVYSIDQCKVDFANLQKGLKNLNKKIPLGEVSVALANDEGKYSENDFELLQSANKNIALSNKTYLQLKSDVKNEVVFKITPANLMFNKCIDLGLVKFDKFSADISVYVKLELYASDDNMVVIDSCCLDKVCLNLSAKLDGQKGLNLGLFKVDFENCNFGFSVDITPDGEKLVSDPTIGLSYKKLNLKAGGCTIVSLDKGSFSYNFETKEWTLPDEIQRFASFSGSNLITQVHTVLVTFQSALRNLVESKTKLDFLDGSIEKVVDIVEKVEQVVYGDESGDSKYGLTKCVDGQYVQNFDDVVGFVEKFNDSWKHFFNDDNDFIDKDTNSKIAICAAEYFKEGSAEGQLEKIVFDDNGISTNGDAKIAKLTFNLPFKLEHYFGLNFAKALSNALANIATNGNILVTADAGISFDLLIDFRPKKIGEDSKLSDIGLTTKMKDGRDEITVKQNDYYVTYEVGASRTFDTDLYINLVDPNKNASDDDYKLGTIIVNAGNELSETTTYNVVNGNGKKSDFASAYYTSDGQLYITSKKEFNIEKGVVYDKFKLHKEDGSCENIITKSSGGDAFAELKLTGSNLQTMYTCSEKDGEWKIYYVASDNSEAYESITIKKDVLKELSEAGFILSNGSDLKNQINEYLSLQKDTYNKNDLLNDIAELGTKLANGRSIMNTFGLYVVDVNGTEIVFGCDPRLIQGYSADEKGKVKILHYLLCDSSKACTYMRISGNITPSMNTVGLQGAFVYEKGKDPLKAEFVKFDKDVLYESESAAESAKNSSLSALPSSLNGKVTYVVEKVEKTVILSDDKTETKKYWILSLQSKNDTYAVEMSDRILQIDVGQQKIYLNVEKCLTVASLADTIKNTLECYENETGYDDLKKINSVSVVDGSIVFTATDDSVEIKIYNNESSVISLEKKRSDFTIGDVEIDFQECVKTLNLDDGTSSNQQESTIANLLKAINESKDPEDNKEVKEKFEIELVGDHFEIYRKDGKNEAFTIKAVGTSKALEWLGFTSGQCAKDINGTYKLVGNSLVGIDWTKAIRFEGIKLDANLTFAMETPVNVDRVKNGNGCVTLYINENDKNAYNADGFLRIVENTKVKYYRILKVDVDSKTNKVKSIQVTTTPLGSNNSTNVTESQWKSAKYVANASATLGFLGVDVIADGNANIGASFTLTKKDENKTNSDKLEVFGYEVGAVLEGNGSFAMNAYADVFGDGIKLFNASVKLVKPNELTAREEEVNEDLKKKGASDDDLIQPQDCYRLDADFKFEDDFKKILNSFKEFSIEKLFVILENVIKRIEGITDNTNAKIPVINKSVKDLVSVASDLREVIAKLRAEKITSIQKFGDLLNTYLADDKFGLTPHNTNSKLFELVPVYESNKFKELEFRFDIQKAFKVRHRFDFGGSSSGISGNADLDVSGDFWFNLSATLDFTNDFDLSLKDGIAFGANVAISGDKLRFDLGINKQNDESLLSNLISVGSKENAAFIYAKVGLLGTVKPNGSDVKISSGDDGFKIDYTLPVAIFGKLPVYACNMSLGDVFIGKYLENGKKVVFNEYNDFITARDNVKDTIEAYLTSYLADPQNTKVDDSLYDLKDLKPSNGDAFGVGIRTGRETDDARKDLDKKLIVDFSKAYEEISKLANFANLDWFSKIKLAVAGLNNLFEMLESGMNSNMGSKLKSVPVLGSALSSGVDFLSILRDKVLDPFSKFVYESTGLTAEMVAKKMNLLLDGYLLNVNVDDKDDYYFNWGQMDKPWIQSGGNGKGTWYRNDDESAEWFFNLGGTYKYGKSIDFDLGFPGLGLSSNAGLDLSLSWALEFGFGISREKGFYFIFGDGDELSVKAYASLNGEIEGSLAGLGLKLETLADLQEHPERKAEITLDFGVDLSKPEDGGPYEAEGGHDAIFEKSGDLTETEKANLRKEEKLKTSKYGTVSVSNAFTNIDFDYSASVKIVAGITVGITKDLDRDTPKFPNICGRFEFEWGVNSKTGKKASVDKLGFYDLTLDMGSFIGGVLGPIISKIQKVIEPLEPLIDFLTTPFPVLKDLGIKMTPLDLAKKYSKGKFDDRMIYAIKDLIAVSKTISAINGKGLSIDLGKFELIGGPGDENVAKSFLEGKSPSSDVAVANYAKSSDSNKSIESIKDDANKELKKQGLNMEGSGEWTFIWNNPSDIFKLLLGEDIDLVTYRMPELCFNFDWSTFVRIWGPLGARIGVNFSASIQLGFGYDTLGIRQWVKSDYKDYGRLLNGFYVADKDKKGVDINELSFYGGLTASAELNAGISAGVGGGVGINVGFNLYDPNQDGKVRLSEMGQIIKEDGLFGLFDVNGKITAKLYAYVDLLFYTKKWNITGDITLFKFDYKHSTVPVMASRTETGDVVAHVGPNASDRISTNDLNPTLTDGDEKLELELEGKEVKWADGKKHDSVEGDEGKLIIDAGAGNDKIRLTGRADFDIEIIGGDGDDVIDLSGLDMENDHVVVIWGGAGNDTIFGAKTGMNIIYGDGGYYPTKEEKKNKNYFIEGRIESGVAGNDTIVGGSGNDFIFGGLGDDKIDGGAGNDYLFGDGGRVVFENGETKVDRTDISADGGHDVILGGAGADVVYGGSGNDHIDGGDGQDVIYGERGHDVILGGADKDTIRGGSGHDIIFGDTITSDVEIGNLFNTKFFSEEFRTAQFADDSEISKSEFEFSAKKYDGQDEKRSIDSATGTGVDYIYGDEGDDLIFGDSGNETDNDQGDTIEGGIGNDIIDGNGGDDTISGGIDNDIIYGGVGNDIIDGGAGNDSLYGDEGIRGKKGNRKFVGEQITFGENKGLLGEVYKDIQSSADGGNDKIMTGPGMDFVDGQGGSDQIIVNLMGESETNYANITDTGTGEFDKDTLTIEGTEYNDNLLMRMNKDESLGFVALLPENNLTPGEVGNENIERVNFTKGIDVVNLNANGGDDKITIDGTAKVTNVDGGAGNDSFQIGQLYNSKRDAGTQGIALDDGFNTIQTDKEKFLSDGVTAGTSLNIEGGVGNDSFTSLHNAGLLSMAGGRGNDTFSIYNYVKKPENGQKEGEPIYSAAMSVDGGAGDDKLNVAGTTGDDTVIISKEGLLSNSVGVKVAGVETSNFDAGAGDDIFHVIGNNEGETTLINGGHGNDTVSVGGLDQSETLRSADNDGQTNYLNYKILTSDSNELSKAQKDAIDIDVDGGVVYNEKFTVLDTSNEPTVFYSLSDEFINFDNLTIEEGKEGVFYIGYSGNLNGGEISVHLTVPMLSSTALQRGDRGILIAIDETNIVYKKELDIKLKEDCRIVKIHVKALSDEVLEETMMSSIAVESVFNNQKLTRSVNTISVNVVDDGKHAANEYEKLFTRTDEFIVQEAEINLGEFAEKFDWNEGVIYVSVKDGDRTLVEGEDADYTIANGVLKLNNLTDFENQTLLVNYRSDSMRLDGSKLRLVYDNLDVSTIKIEYENDLVNTKDASAANAEIYYALNGDGLVFFNKSNNRLISLHGTVKISHADNKEYAKLPEDAGLGSQNPSTQDCVLKFEAVDKNTPYSHVLAEKFVKTTTEVVNGETVDKDVDEDNTTWNSTTYSVKYNGPIADGKSVFVKVYASQVVSEKDKPKATQLGIWDGTKFVDSIILEFNNENQKKRTLTIVAKSDKIEEEYGWTTIDEKSNLISDVEGSVYAYGEGTSMTADFDNPEVLEYNHHFKDGESIVNASEHNEKNSYDVSGMGKVVKIDGKTVVFDGSHASGLKKHDTIKIVMGDFESKWFRVEEINPSKDGVIDTSKGGNVTLTLNDVVEGFDGSEVYVMFSGPKDYLFTSEADNTDRIFVNNQGSGKKANSALSSFSQNGVVDEQSTKFTHSELKGEIVANNFEYGEYNLGSGVDTVDISKTHYRNDGFQTFTVVNTGKGDDTINVNSYKNEADGQLVVNAEEGNDHIYAPNPKLNLGEETINKDGMVVFGGDGEDIINVGRGVIAFGDKGNIQYKNAKDETVTNLGYEEVEEDNVKTGKLIRTKISKDPKTKELQKQTDGIVRGATSIKSVMDEEGAHDEITAGGTNSIVIGGADKDTISVGGDDNVVLGDNGEIAYATTESQTAKWDDPEKPTVKLKHVMTTSDDVGAKDTITISGNSNVAMGGAANDTITIGSEDEKDPDATEQSVSEENSTGNANVVLGDGGVYEFDKQSNTVTVHTSREEKNGKVTIYGDKDEIKIYGGHNTVMGGAAGDDIDIYGADNIVLGDGGIAVRDDKKDVAESIKSVQTTDDSEGGVDNINVWGGDNTVMGGADGDNINIGGNLEKEGEEEKSIVLSNNNVVLGDGGKYERQSADSKTIETTHDSIGGVDTINIYGGNNTVMGGAVGDTINIGIAGQPNSGANNIILGDGGKYVENSTEKTVQTTSDAIGGVDTIHVYGGSNVAMGGADGDKIYIGEAKGTVNQNGEVSVGYDSDNNVVLGDGGKYDLQKNESLDIRTTSDEIGGSDTIIIHGGKNAVMGGFRDDKIDIYGADNVVLGDGGIANYDKHPEVVKEDTSVNAGLIKIETTADEIEVVKEGDDPVRLNDNITIHGDINIVMGGVDDDNIVIDGADNVVVGDAGVYTVRAECLTVETKNEPFGGQDYIQTGDGQNTILGGTDADTILTGTGNDIIVGDGGLVIMDKPDGKNKGHNPLIVTNSGKNVDEERAAEEYEREQANKNEEVVQTDGDSTGTPDDSGDGSVDQTDTVKPPVRSAGGDFIYAGDGDNVIFGGLGKDHIESGKGEDVVFGDNGYATFRGNADLANNLQNTFTDLEGVFEFTNAPEVRTDSTLSFNFQGAAQQGINPDEKAGVSEFEALQWNNITGNLAGTYGNDDKEMVRFNDGTRASSVSVTYAGREAHRTTSTDNSINLQNYNHWLWGNSANNRLMTSGIMTTAPNNMMQNVMEVTIDGLKQYYDSYQVIVYLDLPDANSWAEQSIREVTLTVGDFKQSIFVNDYQGANFNGGFKKSTYQSAEEIIDIINANKTKPANERVDTYGNYVVFEVSADVAHDIDRAIITIQDGYTKDQMNGKDIPGIAGLQIKGVHHKQDIAASTDVAFGGNDSILTRGGDDIVVGGTGGDNIVTHGGDNVIDEDGKIVPRVTETATASSASAQDESGDGAAQVQESDEAKRKREIAEHVAAHTTFGDERLGIYDNDVVFGDNAKMLFTERDGNPETASTLTTAESVTIAKGEISHSEKDSDGNELKDEFKYKDTIITGDGNDVVVGGIGADHIESGATAAANEMMDGINVLSINFTREHSNASDSIAAGEAAGVVVDNDWHNFYRNDRGVIVSDTAYSQSQSDMNAYNEAMNRLCNSPDSSNPYAVSEGVEVHMYGKMNGQRQGPSSFTIENHDEIDGDTSNSKLYNTYIASQQSEEIVLKLLNLDTFVGNSGNTIDTTSYDLYVYIGGDNNDTDTFNYLYEIKLTDAQGNTYRRYLNDWTGHKFDGDYKEAYCTNKQKALEALTDFTTPRVEIIGNYVVFHGVTGNMADIRIRNVFSLNGQSPKNLPMITAVQIVSGDGRYKESENGSLEFNDKHYELADIAVGGDHDKDLVYGDEAKLWFDLDVPFASDENIADYKNRVIEAKSIAVDDDVVKAVSTEDYIETGKDRDVVVAGEGADDIRTGAGDDVVLGGSANLIVEHNNPVGVFTPNTEIVLDQHTINTNLHQNYLDNDNANVGQFQNLLNQNRIAGIDTSVPNTNDRLDQIDAGEGRNITSQASYSTEKLVVEPPPPAPPAPDPINQGSGEGQGSGVTTGDVVLTSSPQIVSLTAGETIKLVCTDYPKGNQWWTPNVVIYGNNAGNGVIPEIDWAWDGETRVHTNVTNNVRVDIPDHPNGANGTYEIYLTAKTSGMIFLYVDQG